jgi:hypothetical protein
MALTDILQPQYQLEIIGTDTYSGESADRSVLDALGDIAVINLPVYQFARWGHADDSAEVITDFSQKRIGINVWRRSLWFTFILKYPSSDDYYPTHRGLCYDVLNSNAMSTSPDPLFDVLKKKYTYLDININSQPIPEFISYGDTDCYRIAITDISEPEDLGGGVKKFTITADYGDVIQ